MALDTTGLKTALKASMIANISNPTAQQQAEIDALAGAWATAFTTFVKTMTITTQTPSGLAAPSGGGTVTGALLYTLT